MEWFTKLIRKRRYNRRCKQVDRLLNTAQCLTGETVGGWGFNGTDLDDTMSVAEIKSALIHYAELLSEADAINAEPIETEQRD